MIVKNLKEALFIIASITVISDLFTLHCPPVQENSSAVIKTEIKNFTNEKIIYFFKGAKEILNCKPSRCFLGNKTFSYTRITNSNETNHDKYILTIKIFTNTSWIRKQESVIGEWKVHLQNDLVHQNCDLKVYAIYGEPNCSWKLENVTCSISKVYPEAKCNLNGTFGEDGKNITYQHITIENENGTYYNTSCTFRIEAANENQNMTVTIYPNVTGKDTDSQYGKTITLKVPDLSTTVQFTTTIPHSSIGSNDSTYPIISVTNTTYQISTNIENISLNVIAATSLSAFIFIGIVTCVIILLIRRKRGYVYENNKSTSIDKFGKNHRQVIEIDNIDIYNVVTYRPKCPSKLIDPYSTVEELYSKSNNVRDSTEKNDKNVYKKCTKNCTGLQNSRGKETNAHRHNKAPALSKETTNPTQIKRVVFNDSQYTLVNKEGEKIKTQNNQDVYSNVDVIKTGSTTSLASTVNHLPRSLKRVIFNNKDYTLVEKPPKLKGTSKEKLLNDIDSNDAEVDAIKCSSVFAQYK